MAKYYKGVLNKPVQIHKPVQVDSIGGTVKPVSPVTPVQPVKIDTEFYKKFKYNAPSDVVIFDKNNDSQINSYFDAVAMSSNNNVEHSNILDDAIDWTRNLFKSDIEKEFYYKFKAATGRRPDLSWTMLGPGRDYAAFEAYKALKEGKAYSKGDLPTTMTSVTGLLSPEMLEKFKNDPNYIVPENAKTIYEITDKWGYPVFLSNRSEVVFKVDENNNIELNGDKQHGVGGRYSDGHYEFDSVGEWLFGKSNMNHYENIGKGFKNTANDIVQVTVDTFQPMFADPSLNSGKIVINNLLVNLSETLDMFTFWKPLLQETVDQYNAIKEPGEKFNIFKFWNVLWNRTPGTRTAKLRALARYYGLDVDEHGHLSGHYEGGRHQVDYENVFGKLFNWDTTINVLEPMNAVLDMVGTILNGYVSIFDPDSTFGTNWGQGKFEINVGDLALEMIDPSFIASGFTDVTMATKTSKYIKANSRAIAEETVDKMFKNVDYKTFSYSDRLQMYDYMEQLIYKNADNLGSATSKDFLKTLRTQQKSGEYFKTKNITETNALNYNVSKMMLDYERKVGGYINPDILQKQILDAQDAISSAVVRHNANTVTTSLLGGLTDFGHLTQQGPLTATFLGLYPLADGIRWLGNKIGIKDKLKTVSETFFRNINLTYKLEIAKAKEYANMIKNIDNKKVTNNVYMTKKLEQIIKENILSFTAIDKSYLELGANPDLIVSIQARVITETVLPDIIDILKSGKNPQEMLEEIMISLI